MISYKDLVAQRAAARAAGATALPSPRGGTTNISGLASLNQTPPPSGDGWANINALATTEANRQGQTLYPGATGGGQAGGLSSLAPPPPPPPAQTASAGPTGTGTPPNAAAHASAAPVELSGSQAALSAYRPPAPPVVPGSDPTKPGTGPPGGNIPPTVWPQLPDVPPIPTDQWGNIVAGLAGLAEKQWGSYGSTPQYGGATQDTAGSVPGGSTYTPYTLPGDQQAMGQMRQTQQQGLSGLQSLAQDPTNEQRINQLSQAIYDPQAQAINQAARLQQQQMLEGTFARGTGSSTITADLAGKLSQAQNQALANAQQNAYVAARGQANQDLSAYQNLAQGLFGAGTSGLQAEANVGLANAQNQMGAGQFGQGMQFTAEQNDANRALQQAMQSSGFQFTGDQAALQRSFDQHLATMGYAVQAGSQASNQRFQAAMQQSNQSWQGSQTRDSYAFQSAMLQAQQAYDAARLQSQQNYQTIADTRQQGFESQMLGSQQNFTAMENAKNQGWQATQNEAQRQLQILLQTMQNAQAGDEQARAMINGNISAFIRGLVGIFGGINTGNTPQAGG